MGRTKSAPVWRYIPPDSDDEEADQDRAKTDEKTQKGAKQGAGGGGAGADAGADGAEPPARAAAKRHTCRFCGIYSSDSTSNNKRHEGTCRFGPAKRHV